MAGHETSREWLAPHLTCLFPGDWKDGFFGLTICPLDPFGIITWLQKNITLFKAMGHADSCLKLLGGSIFVFHLHAIVDMGSSTPTTNGWSSLPNRNLSMLRYARYAPFFGQTHTNRYSYQVFNANYQLADEFSRWVLTKFNESFDLRATILALSGL